MKTVIKNLALKVVVSYNKLRYFIKCHNESVRIILLLIMILIGFAILQDDDCK